MKISDIFKGREAGLERAGCGKRACGRMGLVPERNKANAQNEDTVTISPLCRQLSQISHVLSEDEIATSARIADIKQKIEVGDYSVSSEELAESVLDYSDTE